MKQTAFRLTDEDLALLDEAKKRNGLFTRADALRFLLRYWAKRESLNVARITKKGRTK